MEEVLQGDAHSIAESYADFLTKFPNASPIHRAKATRRMENYRTQIMTNKPEVRLLERKAPEDMDF